MVSEPARRVRFREAHDSYRISVTRLWLHVRASSAGVCPGLKPSLDEGDFAARSVPEKVSEKLAPVVIGPWRDGQLGLGCAGAVPVPRFTFRAYPRASASARDPRMPASLAGKYRQQRLGWRFGHPSPPALRKQGRQLETVREHENHIEHSTQAHSCVEAMLAYVDTVRIRRISSSLQLMCES